MQTTQGAFCVAAIGDFSRFKRTGSAKASFVNSCELPRLCGRGSPVCSRAYEGNTSGIPPAQRCVHPRASPSFPSLLLPPYIPRSREKARPSSSRWPRAWMIVQIGCKNLLEGAIHPPSSQSTFAPLNPEIVKRSRHTWWPKYRL